MCGVSHLTTELTLLDEELLVSGGGGPPKTTAADPLEGAAVEGAGWGLWLTPPLPPGCAACCCCLTDGGYCSLSESLWLRERAL